jgi:NADP-dependent aldehyde dehydrogenase
MEGLPGEGVAATIFEIDAESVTPDLIEETFGPTTLVIRADPDQLAGVIDALPGSLTATVQGEPDEAELVRTLFDTLRPKAGRLLYGGFPTGVLVAWAQNHGGPWPATNTQYTSVGADSIRRWLRPLTWQDAPDWLLPSELRDADPGIPRRIDGALTVSTAP